MDLVFLLGLGRASWLVDGQTSKMMTSRPSGLVLVSRARWAFVASALVSLALAGQSVLQEAPGMGLDIRLWRVQAFS